MANLTLDMSGQQFISELNDAIEAASLSGGPSGTTSTIFRTVSMQMQMGKIDTTGANEGYIARNTATNNDDNFNNYCHTILMLGIENCTVSSITTQTGESLTIFCYGYDSTNGGPLRYKTLVTDPSNIPANTCYIKIMLKNNNGFNVMRQLEVKVAGKPTFIKNITPASNTPQYFSFETSYPSTAEKDEVPEVFTDNDFNDAALEPYMGAGGGASINCYDNGFIVLPPNYHAQDAAVPLIVYCHDKGEFGWDYEVNSKNARIFSFLANNGYAVCDCYGLTSNHKNSVNAYYAPSYVSSIACLLKFIYANYNIRTDGIYICGKSSGAFISLLLPYLQGFKVKAAAGLSPVISAFIALRKGDDTHWSNNFANLIWSQLNISKATTSTTEYIDGILGEHSGNHILDTYTAYLNIPLLRRYDALFKTINLTDEELKAFIAQYYIKNQSNIDKLHNSLINDNGVETAAKNVIDNGKITTKCPVKLWCSEGDIDVATNSKWFVKWCKDGGSPAYMRKLPAGTQGSGNVSSHDLVDTIGNNDLKISYTPKFGDSVYETIAICEMVDFFNQW